MFSDLLPLNDFKTLLLSITLLAVVPHLLSFLLFPHLLPLALERCFRTWAMVAYHFYFLRSSVPTFDLLPLIYRMLVEMILTYILTLTVLLQRNTRLFLFSISSAHALFTLRTQNAVKFFIYFGRIQRQPQAW